MSEEFKSVKEFAQSIYGKLSKRAQVVVDEIIKNGFVTTEKLAHLGYDHPPRAVRDVREAGIPLKTIMVKSKITNRRMASYVFGDVNSIQYFKSDGRRTFSKDFKRKLLIKQHSRCAICGVKFDENLLQIDHRIPYEYMGDPKSLSPDVHDFMLLCAECNRKKDQATKNGCSKTCFKTKNIKIIRSCYWASPENYNHICMKPIRRADLTWFGQDEVNSYDSLRKKALSKGQTVPDLIKDILRESED